MKRQLLILFATLLAIAPAMSQNYDFSATAPTGQTLYYRINGSNATVTGHENNISGNLIIPASVSYNNNTYIVTSIKANAFSNCSGLTSVVVPNTVSAIESSAFENCSGLASFTMGNGKAGERGGLFSSSSGTQVRFAQGNLQFQASTGTWRLADHQYDIIGADNTNISSTYSGWIDLFGWGTSGWNSGANAYQPWATNSDYTDYYPGGSYSNSLTGTYARADWGVYNAISNGGDAPGLWRVPTKDEWVYITKSRRGSTVNGVANARFAKVRVNGINGLLLFPDSYTHPNCVTQPTNINVGGADYGANNYTTEDIDAMESAGAVFLPAAGFRTGGGETSVSNVGTHGQYWSSTHDNFARACCLSFITDGSSELEPFYCIQRQRGRPVRLVRAPSGQQTTLGSRVFSGANNLTQANFSGTLIEWLNIDFNDAQSNPMAKSHKLAIGGEVITNLVIPTGVTEVKKYAFYNDTVVTSLTLSSCITTVADSAFAGMTNLVNLTLDGFSELPTYSTKAFDGIDKSAVTVVVPCSLLDIAVNTNWGGFSHFRGEGTPIMTLQQTNGGTVEITDANTCTSNDITLTAFPNNGFIFVQWNDGNTDNPRTLTVTHDITLTAIFSRQQVTYPITLVVTPDEAIAAGCTVNGPTSYTSMLNNVIPNGDFESGTLDINITYTDNTAYNGHYEYGPDFGVDSSWGIYMDGALSYNVYFLIDTFAINPNHMYEFSYDMRPVEGSPPIIKTIINDNTFIDSLLVDEIWQHQSHIFTATSDSAIIQMVDLNIAYWGNDWFLDNICLYDLTQNAAIFTFTEAGGYEFVEWYVNDTYAGNGDTLYLTPDTATTVEARFSNNNARYTVTLNANNDAYGTVSGGGTYAAGETATLIATPNCGCWFTHWEDQYGNVLGAGTLTITVNSDATYTAVFEAVPTTNIQLQCSTGQTLVYSLDCNNSTATLTGYVGTPTGALEIPSSISYYGRSYDVTHIDDLVFYVCRQITSVTIPNSVTTIGSQAFLYCDGLTSLYIPASVNEIGNYAFMGCGHLETIVVSDNNTVFDSRNNCNALIHTESNTLIEGCCNTVIPNDVVRLGYGAFHSSTLRSIVIPNSVVDMSIYVFSNCDNLTSIVVADGNPVFDSRDNCNAIIQTSTNTLVSGCKNTVIPNTVTSIGPSAFAFCNAMTTVTIPSSITYIANEGFRECRNLTSITCLATTPPTLDQESFYQSPMNIPVYVPCGSLASYQAAQWWSDFTNIQDDCGTHTEEVNIRTCTGQTLRYEVNNRTHTATVIGYVGQCNGGLTIPAWFSIDDVRYTVTAIGPRAFENCRGLESVILPRSITLVDTEAFKNCSALINVDIK